MGQTLGIDVSMLWAALSYWFGVFRAPLIAVFGFVAACVLLDVIFGRGSMHDD